jgi:hypothetical protein
MANSMDILSSPRIDELHILVHNVSHADLILGVCAAQELAPPFPPTLSNHEQLLSTFAKPTFDKAAAIGELLLSYKDRWEHSGLGQLIFHTPDGGSGQPYPIGITLTESILVDSDWLAMREPQKRASLSPVKMKICALYFPLLSVLVHYGRSLRLKAKRPPSPCAQRTIYLLSGPVYADDSDSLVGSSSTEFIGSLLVAFMTTCQAGIVMHHICVTTEVTRYDANVRFVKQAVCPLIDSQRKHLVSSYPDSWRKHFTVSLSLAAGAHARVTALNAGLRIYQPSYLHLSNVKALWYSADMQAALSSVHFVDYDSVEATPAVPATELEEDIAELVVEMKHHIENVLKVVRGTTDYRTFIDASGEHIHPVNLFAAPEESATTLGAPPLPPAVANLAPLSSTTSMVEEDDHELASFWLRKTRQPVLAVLQVRQGLVGKAQYFYGMNVEVSMPTGSVCSERVAISMALAMNPWLKRADIRAVAVISLPKLDHPDSRVQYAYESVGVAPASNYYKASHSQHAPTKSRVELDAFSPAVDAAPRVKRQRLEGGTLSSSDVPSISEIQSTELPQVAPGSGLKRETEAVPVPKNDATFSSAVSPNARERNFACIRHPSSDGSGFTVEVPVALNPIAPCGSCMEWLKKVAEINPDFKIVTFTDISCDRVYIKNVQLN